MLYPVKPPGMPPMPRPLVSPARRPRRRPRPQRAPLPAYGGQSWYPRGRFTQMRGVSTPRGYTRDGGRLTAIPKRQTQLPFGLMGGTSAQEWAYRKGIREARGAADTQLSRYYARRGLTGGGQEAAGMRDVYTKFGQMLAEGLSGIQERYQNQMMSQLSQYLARRGKRSSRTRVVRVGSQSWLDKQLEKAREREGGY